ncbi:MAG: RNA polymerase sigma factor [Limisphaerales bacterium]
MNIELTYVADFAVAQRESIPTRRSLLTRLRNLDDDASWQTFFDTYWRLIYNVARKSGLADAEAQDIVQETVIAVALKMPEFRYDRSKGSFKQWLLLITRRRIQDHFRKMYRSAPSRGEVRNEFAPALGEEAHQPGPDAEIESVWEDEWRGHVFQAALARVRHKSNPKHYQVFDYCVLRDLPAAQVARMLGLNAAQVYLAKHRVSHAVRRAAREIEAELSQASCR